MAPAASDGAAAGSDDLDAAAGARGRACGAGGVAGVVAAAAHVDVTLPVACDGVLRGDGRLRAAAGAAAAAAAAAAAGSLVDAARVAVGGGDAGRPSRGEGIAGTTTGDGCGCAGAGTDARAAVAAAAGAEAGCRVCALPLLTAGCVGECAAVVAALPAVSASRHAVEERPAGPPPLAVLPPAGRDAAVAATSLMPACASVWARVGDWAHAARTPREVMMVAGTQRLSTATRGAVCEGRVGG
jgi:hypothetical protein